MRVISEPGDTLDKLCYRHTRTTAGITEQVLALNAGLADLGEVLPSGTQVQLPSTNSQQQTNTINLWD